ncbi:hypothetical protein D3C80_2012490 [compost metagenome]
MGGTGHGRKRRGRGNQFGPRLPQLAVEFGEAQVITHSKTNPAHRCVGHHDLIAMSIVIGLTVASAIVRDIDIKQMQLVITRYGLAVFIDQQ